VPYDSVFTIATKLTKEMVRSCR